MKRKTRRNLRIAVLLGAVLLLTACIMLPDFIGQSKAGKYDPVEEAPRPDRVSMTPIAQTQTQPHTCGLHAMRSMYIAYGLSPGQFDLRFRLGTDEPAMRVDPQSAGTLHPDLYRVLAQDGFAFTALDLDDPQATGELQDHLRQQQLALAVVYRGTYHWVLLSDSEHEGDLVVCDSLRSEPGVESMSSLLDEALSITLVQPAATGQTKSSTDAHAAGLAEMYRLYQRKE